MRVDSTELAWDKKAMRKVGGIFVERMKKWLKRARKLVGGDHMRKSP